MKLSMVNLTVQYEKIKEEINASIQETLDSTQFILGKKVTELEQKCAEYLNVKRAAACASGTDALQIALMTMDIKPGDEVITTPFTFVATAETIALLGAVPVYVDVNEDDFNIDVSKIEAAVTKKTKAIIPVHLYGQSADMDPIMEIARKHNLYVIEDMAQAFGTEYKGQKVGGLGHIGATSFFPSKNLGCYGDGGMMFTNDDALADRLKMICNHGSKVRYIHETLGVNSRLDTIQAAVLLVKIKYIDEYNKKRAKNAEYYNSKLHSSKIKIPVISPFTNHIFHQYTIRVENRDRLADYLNSKGIPFGVYYPIPLHQQPAYKNLGGKSFKLPISEKASKEVISLPMYPELTIEEMDYITNAILEFVGE